MAPRPPAGLGSAASAGRALPACLQREPADDRRWGPVSRSIPAVDPLARRHVASRFQPAPGRAWTTHGSGIRADSADQRDGQWQLLRAPGLLDGAHAPEAARLPVPRGGAAARRAALSARRALGPRPRLATA